MKKTPAVSKKVGKVVCDGIKKALEIIRENCEDRSKPYGYFNYHNRLHTMGVIKRTEKILTIIHHCDPGLVSTRTVELGKLFAGYHDTLQNWAMETMWDRTVFPKRIRKRMVGKNEEDSAIELSKFMDEVNRITGSEFFTHNERACGTEAILATIPQYDARLGTVIQPNLHPLSSIVARAVGLADLGSVGMRDGKFFLKEGNSLFQEENLDIQDAVKFYKFAPSSIPDDYKSFVEQRMMSWTRNQYWFAVGRKELNIEEIHKFPAISHKPLLQAFPYFEDALSTITKAVIRRSRMSFKELLVDFGYLRSTQQ